MVNFILTFKKKIFKVEELCLKEGMKQMKI